MRILSIVPNLMLRSQLAQVLQTANLEHKSFRRTEDLLNEVKADATATVIIDLNASGCDPIALIREIKSIVPDMLLLTFFSHVDHEKETLALEAGADVVLPRSKFFGKVLELIQAK